MIKTERINGLEFQYLVVEPSRLDLEFDIGRTVKQLGSEHEAAINFPYADLETGIPIGMVVSDGVAVIQDLEKTKSRDMFYVTTSETACIGPYPRTPIKWGVKGSPRLLRAGKNVLKESIARDKTPWDITGRKSQRTAMGIRADGSVVLLVTNTIMYLEELTTIMQKLECVDALNGDGGGSSYLWPEDTGWGRKVGAAVVVKKEVVKKMKMVIEAGHYPETPGKRCPDDSMREFHFNSPVANYVVEALNDYENVETLMTHSESRDVPLQERTDRANAWKADVFVSIHANAHGTGNVWTDVSGVETFVHHNASRASVALAVAIQRNLVSASKLSDRGVKREDFHVLRETKMPAVLVECGFMTNKNDATLLRSDRYRRECADAIVKSLVETYGLQKKATPVKMPTKAQVPVIQKVVSVSVNDGPELQAYIINDITHVPVRFISETFGADVDWNGGNPVKITKKDV